MLRCMRLAADASTRGSAETEESELGATPSAAFSVPAGRKRLSTTELTVLSAVDRPIDFSSHSNLPEFT